MANPSKLVHAGFLSGFYLAVEWFGEWGGGRTLVTNQLLNWNHLGPDAMLAITSLLAALSFLIDKLSTEKKPTEIATAYCGVGLPFKTEQRTLYFGSDSPLLLMTLFSRPKQQQKPARSSSLVRLQPQLYCFYINLNRKEIKTYREMKQQHLLPGRPVDKN